MKKIIILLSAVTILSSFSKPKENYPFDKWDAATLQKANTAKDASGYSDEEMSVVYYSNLVRLNPNLFARTFLAKYLDSTNAKQTSFSKSLTTDLTLRYKPVEVLTVKSDLTEEAKDHAMDSGKSGVRGHFTSDGHSYEARMKKFKGTYASTAENCDYGNKDGLSIVIHLLIDEGEASVQHRKTILNKKLQYVGVSIQPHKKEKWTCVMDFASDKH